MNIMKLRIGNDCKYIIGNISTFTKLFDEKSTTLLLESPQVPQRVLVHRINLALRREILAI